MLPSFTDPSGPPGHWINTQEESVHPRPVLHSELAAGTGSERRKEKVWTWSGLPLACWERFVVLFQILGKEMKEEVGSRPGAGVKELRKPQFLRGRPSLVGWLPWTLQRAAGAIWWACALGEHVHLVSIQRATEENRSLGLDAIL